MAENCCYMRVRREVKKEAQRRRKRHVRAEQHTEQGGSHKMGWYRDLIYSWLLEVPEMRGRVRHFNLKLDYFKKQQKLVLTFPYLR